MTVRLWRKIHDTNAAASGTQVTLTFAGSSVPPTVRVNSVEQGLNAQRQLTLEVPAGANFPIAVDYPAESPLEEIFHLFFDYDKPLPGGWSANPPSAAYQRYLNNVTTPLDTRFQTSNGSITPTGSTAPRGAAALQQ